MKVNVQQVRNPPIQTLTDKGLVPSVTNGNGFEIVRISSTPLNSGYVKVLVNGQLQRLGDGISNLDCYFVGSGLAPFVSVLSGFNGGAFRSNRSLWLWGTGSDGQLGESAVIARSSPVSVLGNHSFALAVASLDSAGAHIVALKTDGTAWAWGANNGGGLGINTVTDRSSPVSVLGGHSFIAIACGDRMSSALKADGTIWSWGRNNTGHLGDNTVANKSSPISLIGAHSFTAINNTGGGNFQAGLKSDGSVWTWGTNAGAGSLGDNTATNRSSPVSVVGTHSFIKLAGGNTNMAALKSDGSVWTWGEGGGGRLGNNASTNRSSPVSVVGGHSFVEVSAVANHYAALKADGTIWAWGNNGSGQLGQNSVASRSSPISVVGDHSFTGVMAAVSSTFAVKADGSVWAWGANGDGRLGDGTITNRSSPVQILGSTLALPRSINQIVADDRLVWNGARAGFDLDASDLIDLVYVV